LNTKNPCVHCINQKGIGEECCIDVFIILNPDELQLFKHFSGYYPSKRNEGAVFYTKKGCPYLDHKNRCSIHTIKPLYCKYYPIFITGMPYTDDQCPAHQNSEFILTSRIEKEIYSLQSKYPIYTKEWLWEDVLQFIHKSSK
jgi:hypothetical protein